MAMLSLSESLHLACILEATAQKAGNVTRYRDFDDLTYLDFVTSAAVASPILAQAADRGVGPTILEAIRATRRVVATNTNLGIVLLLAPLAAVRDPLLSPASVDEVLNRLTVEDSSAVFEAIRIANPGGLGTSPDQDVWQAPTAPLRAIMGLAADRDLVARQYSNGFRDVLDLGLPALLNEPPPLESAIQTCHLVLLAELPDTHLARRCGESMALEARQRARAVLHGASFHEFDAWLRADGHRRNPGATADLVTACLFIAIRRGEIPFPLRSWASLGD